MQKLFITLMIIMLTGNMLAAQEVTKGDDGVFYGPDQQPYTGIYQEFHPNGQLKTRIPLSQGQIDGQVEVFFADGGKNEIRSYQDGMMHGEWITWNQAGQKIAEAHYNMGEKEGKWTIWHDNGTLLYDMTYSKGQRTGTWKMYSPEGKLINEKTYGQ
ncbi:MAG: toxin-antitoxin system YwqK family antitoxin [Bacteroidales bacterium]